jgi:hypothetical protein
MRILAGAMLAVTLLACTAGERVDLGGVPPCAAFEPSRGALEAGECKLEANGETLHVRYANLPESATGGAVSIDVIGANSAVRQVLLEENVSEYLTPSVQDVDGDGRGDVLIPRETGNVNSVRGVWIFSGEGLYRRAGEIIGVDIVRTDEGLIASPARSSAAAWNVAFHRLDEDGLHLIASVDVEGEPRADGTIATRCTLADAPGIVAFNLTVEAATAKFCAEPAAAGVFGP